MWYFRYSCSWARLCWWNRKSFCSCGREAMMPSEGRKMVTGWYIPSCTRSITPVSWNTCHHQCFQCHHQVFRQNNLSLFSHLQQFVEAFITVTFGHVCQVQLCLIKHDAVRTNSIDFSIDQTKWTVVIVIDLVSHSDVWLLFFVHTGRKQDPVDLVEDPVDADAVAVRHRCLVDEDAALKISNKQTASCINYQPKPMMSSPSTSLSALFHLI